jgi:Protein of unknown function (DUF3662)/FHA domain
MSFLARIEQLCAALIERTFAKTFPSDLEPAQIARKLVATMETATHGDEGELVAPSAYAVYVSPKDFARLSEHREYLERAWADLLRELADKVGVAFAGDLRVTMAARKSVPLGAVSVKIGETARSPREYRLRMIEGVPPDAVFALAGKTRIGRSDESEIVLVDPSVSRAHAVLEIDRGKPLVRDLDSTNGTFVNGRRVASEALRDGDELLFGNTKMRFESV